MFDLRWNWQIWNSDLASVLAFLLLPLLLETSRLAESSIDMVIQHLDGLVKRAWRTVPQQDNGCLDAGIRG
jgi:hypothetical protein